VKGSRAAVLTVGLLAIAAPARADVASCLDAAERAQPLRAAGELREARTRLITCAAASCPRQVRADCTRWLGEVELAVPSVVIQAREADGTDVLDVTLTIDGVPQKRPLDGLAISLDPGKHVFRIDAPGREPLTQTAAIREGEKSRVVTFAFPKPPASRSASPPVAVGAGPERRPSTLSIVPPVAWVAGGLGLLAASTGVVLWVQGVGARDDLREQCASATSCVQGDIDAAKTKLVIGDVLVGAGALAIGAGVWLAVRASSTNVSLGPGRLLLVRTF